MVKSPQNGLVSAGSCNWAQGDHTSILLNLPRQPACGALHWLGELQNNVRKTEEWGHCWRQRGEWLHKRQSRFLCTLLILASQSPLPLLCMQKDRIWSCPDLQAEAQSKYLISHSEVSNTWSARSRVLALQNSFSFLLASKPVCHKPMWLSS